jgi:ribose transport system ATP-binding protein
VNFRHVTMTDGVDAAADGPGAEEAPGPGIATGSLRCADLTKTFGSVTALRNLTFEARMGQVHAILGENGAGKSTFVKILGGTLRPDRGTLSLLDDEVRLGSARAAMAQGVRVAYQEFSLASELTVAENIWLTHGQSNKAGVLSRRDLRNWTQRLIREWDAPRVDPDVKVRNLGVAERQVVEILKSLSGELHVLLLDEATASLPAGETAWAIGVARQVAAAGKLVFFISHRMHEIREVADWVTVFRGGEAVKSTAIDDVDDDAMIESMLGQRPEVIYPKALRPPDRSSVRLGVRHLRGGRLRDVNFDLHDGEILGVGGLDGQGQRDLLLALFGMLRSRGQITVRGEPARFRSPRHALRAGVAMVPEDRRLQGLLMTKTIRENVSLPNLAMVTRRGLVAPWRESRMAEDAIEMLAIRASDAEQRVSTLSGGTQQKVVVAKLLVGGADIILLDDFTRGIDVGTKASLFALLRSLTGEGKSVVFYSSDAQELVEMCDRILVFLDGEITAELSGDDRSEEQLIRAAFGLHRQPEEEA